MPRTAQTQHDEIQDNAAAWSKPGELGSFKKRVVTGVVEHGDARGRTIGFPTANMRVRENPLPLFGIYAVRIHVLDGDTIVSRHDGVTSFGIRPMWRTNDPLMETHFFDFDGDLYGKSIAVELVEYIRPEAKFTGLEALVAQIKLDAGRAREILAR